MSSLNVLDPRLQDAAAEPVPATLPALIEARVAATPQTVAIVDADETLTYAELDRRANAVAARLIAAGVRPGSIVAVLLDRSAAMVAAWLGIVKAGAAYLPLDASYPTERLSFMLDDANAAMLVTDHRHTAALPYGRTLLLDTGNETPVTVSLPQVSPADLAYVIYTSGSTGRPKGVMIEHRNIVNTIQWYVSYFGVRVGDRTGQTTAAGFDAATWDVWGNLLAGAELHIVSEQVRRSPESLCRWVVDHRLDLVFLVTPVASLAIQNGWLDGSQLRSLLTGGDKLHVSPPPGAAYRCYNLYGPTETAVLATCAPVATGGAGVPPIGVPIGGATAYVLDEEGNPASTGELYIGGAGVGRGYLGRPDLTAQMFLPDRFSGKGKIYRTGDLVKLRPDGQLDFIGRVDEQVKISGYRIELGEIEAQLCSAPGVEAAAVTVWRPDSGFSKLVGYVTGTSELDGNNVRTWLGTRLPAHMVPAVVVVLDHLPLTPNQKVDKASLPDPAGYLDQEQRPVLDDVAEQALADDWRVACGVLASGSEDTLVALGASSLDLIALQAQVSLRRDRTIPADALKLTQTLREQAAVIAALTPVHDDDSQIRGSREGLASFGQEAIVFVEEIVGTGMGYQFQMVLEGPGTPEVSLLQRSLEAVVRSQAALSSRWRMTAKGLVGEQVSPATIAFDRHEVATSDVDTLVNRLVDRAMRYDEYPLIRWDLIQHPGGTVLLQREHHLVHDGWSVGVLLSQLQAAYRGFELGTGWFPGYQPATYFDWAASERRRLHSPEGEQARRFWGRHLAEAPSGRPPLPWPVDEDMAGKRSEISMQRFDAVESARLERAAAQLGVTPYALLLTTYRRLVLEFQGGQHTVIGSAYANRDVDTRTVVGMFVNVLPLMRPGDVAETPAVAARAEMALVGAAGRYQWLPTAEIVRAAGHGRQLGHFPLYQVLFSQHDAPLPQLAFGSWRPSVRELGNGHGKNDLNVIVMNRALQHGRSAGRRDLGSWALRWEHDLAMYPGHVIGVLQRRYRRLLEHACTNPDAAWPTPETNWNGEPR